MTWEVKAPVGQLARSADELSRSADETRERLSRRDDRFRGVEELLSAASGLARTIAATEELAQQRAELVRTRRALGGPRPDGNGGPMISLSGTPVRPPSRSATAMVRRGTHPRSSDRSDVGDRPGDPAPSRGALGSVAAATAYFGIGLRITAP